MWQKLGDIIHPSLALLITRLHLRLLTSQRSCPWDEDPPREKPHTHTHTLMILQKASIQNTQNQRKTQTSEATQLSVRCRCAAISPVGLLMVIGLAGAINTFPQAAGKKTQACGCLRSLGLSQSRDTVDPTGERVGHAVLWHVVDQNNFCHDSAVLHLQHGAAPWNSHSEVKRK